MNFTIKTEILEKALNMANVIVPKKSPLLALEGTKIEARESQVIISTTDLENEYISSIQAEVFQEGQTVVPLKSIQQLISKIDYPEISIELKDNILNLNSFGFSAELTTIDTSEYPELTLSASKFQKLLEIESEILSEAINNVAYSSSYPDDSNPVFAGILMETNKKELKLVSTDGSQLAIKKIDKTSQKESKLLVPVKSLKAIQKYIQGNIEISIDNIENPKTVSFKNTTNFGEIAVVSKLIEGNFPEYKEVIPTEFEINIILSKKVLLDAIKRVMVLSKSKELSGIVIFEITKNKMLVKSIESELGKAKEEIVLKKKTGKDLIIHFNGKFLETMLNSISGEDIEISFIDEISPMKVTIPNTEDFLYLLMPVRIAATV
ncbi:MAG: DNA polymerase III subunit beta [Candidatus Calescibacterium sp.]|nr:DNA polymerase III subunit beta [Candidatus Calescibacterium sp.]